MAQTKYDYAIIVALNEEAEYFRRMIACGDPSQTNGFATWPIVDVSWDAFGRGVLVSSGRMGFEAARISTLAVISEFSVKLIANVGIAGRVASWLNLGDVVVPREVIDFTAGGKVAGAPNEPVFQHSPAQKDVTSSLVGLAESYLQKDSKSLAAINETLKSRFSHIPQLWPSKGIQVAIKPLATVPLVGGHDAYRESIAKSHRDIAAMEMEAAGIMAGLSGSAGEFVAVRGISDGADFKKSEIEAEFADENRRMALEAAAAVLEAMLTLRMEQKEPLAPGAGIDVLQPDEALAPEHKAQVHRHEPLFSRLVHGSDGDLILNPISGISLSLRSDEYREPVVLFGGKGVGKTTLMGLIQAQCSQSVPEEGVAGCLSVLIRLSALEVWRDGLLDDGRTRHRVTHACRRLGRIISGADGPVVVLIDGLNQTGAYRVSLIADLAKEALRHCNVRLLLSAESEYDLSKLYGFIPLDVQIDFKIVPVEIDSKDAMPLIKDFALIRQSKDVADVMADMRAKDVRKIDVFILALFFGAFRGVAYRGLTSLAQCFNVYCSGVLTGTSTNPTQRLSDAAKAAFEILISKDLQFGHLNEQATAKLVSSHASVTSFLVARHIIDVLQAAKVVSVNRKNTANTLKKRLNYVFPAEVNSFTKQIMGSDRDIERNVVEVVRSKYRAMSVLGKSHFAYLVGRIKHERRSDMLGLLKQLGNIHLSRDESLSQEARMLRRTIFISRAMLGDEQASREYADILLSDIDESEFNRGFHLEYYGDSEFDPAGRMATRDDGISRCGLTFLRLMERIEEQPKELPPLIELITVLALVQVRNLNGKLRESQRRAVLDLIAGPQLKNRHLLPSNVRGYIERVGEDLETDNFDLATVMQEWNTLPQIARTGWLRRRRDAIGDAAIFWETARIESVAEHLIGVLGLAETFLTSNPTGSERYDKRLIIEMILVHDLAEARLGDQLPKYTDPKAEEVVLWQYGAFETYRGIGDLWRVPNLLQEFNRGESIEAKIAKDLDRLQFILQARSYALGMSEVERQKCEDASENIATETVRQINQIVAGSPTKPRFVSPPPRLD